MDNMIAEDSKVIVSATLTMLIDYAEIFNQIITLMISICTLIYVGNRAYMVMKNNKKHKGKRKRR